MISRIVAVARAVLHLDDPPAPPVEYKPAVVAFVVAVAALAVGVALVTVHFPTDLPGLVLVASAIFLMAAASVSTLPGRTGNTFTATAFLALGLALTLGPVGSLAAATAEALGVLVRFRSGWFRAVFNASQGFLSLCAAWGAYVFLSPAFPSTALWAGFCGLIAGLGFHTVNSALVAGVLRAAVAREVSLTLAGHARVLPYQLMYGYAAVAFVVLHDRLGALGFSFALAPVAALQAFLILLERATRSYERERHGLIENITDKNEQLERSYDATLVALTHALDARDKETEGHSRRVVEYTRLIAVRLGIDGEELKLLCHGALLHDIGKIGVPDAILHKPDTLTEAEWQIMRRHPEIGAAMVEEVEYLAEARRIILHHHERWDGRGYPLGLRGKQIHIGARAFAVADALDAITQDRPYRRGRSFDQAREEIVRCRGSQFDPDAVDAFLSIPEDELLRIAAIRTRVSVDLLAVGPPGVVLPTRSLTSVG